MHNILCALHIIDPEFSLKLCSYVILLDDINKSRVLEEHKDFFLYVTKIYCLLMPHYHYE